MSLIDNEVVKQVCSLIEQKDKYIFQELKKLFDTGIIWLVETPVKHENGKLFQQIKFCFDTQKPLNEAKLEIERLKDENKKLKSCYNCKFVDSEGYCIGKDECDENNSAWEFLDR